MHLHVGAPGQSRILVFMNSQAFEVALVSRKSSKMTVVTNFHSQLLQHTYKNQHPFEILYNFHYTDLRVQYI